MADPSLQDAHALLTDLMIERAEPSEARRLRSHALAPALLDRALRLPLIGSYVDPEEGVVVVDIHEIASRDADRHQEVLRELLGDAELEVRYGRNDNESAPAKDKDARPLWGGVQMDTATAFGTLTLVVKKGDKDRTLISSHVVGYRTTGVTVGQASVDDGGTYGKVTDNPDVITRKSDSALASIDQNSITGQRNRIWKAKDTAFKVVAFADDSELKKGVKMCMQGAFTKPLSHGTILQTGVTSVRPGNTVLTDQVLASYDSTGGDSGGSVFLPGSGDDVTFAGIHVGTHTGGKIFSPWSGIESDLGL